MKVLQCNCPTYFDVDNTLIMWGYANLPGPDTIPVECEGYTQHLVPHKKHINQLKAHKARAHTTIVWSKGGHLWAAAVVKALELEDFVDLVIEKPKFYYDDQQPEDFMGNPIYLKDE